jgi:hypothetical protein
VNGTRVLLICLVIFIAACVKAPVFESHNQALLRSNYPIVRLNGNDIEPSYSLTFAAGNTTAVVVYRSYRYEYACHFTWDAAPGTVYEVTDQEDKYPLTLYRWVRTNRLWASRLSPLDPEQCVKN